MKMILAAILAGSFLASIPARADDKPAGDKAEKSDKGAKKSKKDKSADKGDAPAKSGGGW